MQMPELYSQKMYQMSSMPRNSMFFELMDIADNCLNRVCAEMKKLFPEAKKPLLVLNDINELNACAKLWEGRPAIIINSRLLIEVKDYIWAHLEDSTIETMLGCDEIYTPDHIRKKILVYFIRFTVLHELFHLWHGHLEYLKYLGVGASLDEKSDEPDQSNKEFSQLGNSSFYDTISLNALKQAFEYDADVSAANMLFNLMCQQYDIHSPEVADFQKEIILMFIGILSMFSLFSEESFDTNKTFATKDLMSHDHPEESIRFYYCEDILAAKLFERLGEKQEIELSNVLAPITVDLFANGNEAQVFRENPLLTAYTFKAQDHFLTVKKVFAQVYDALTPYVKSNIVDKPSGEFLKLHSDAIRFDKDGNYLLS